MLRPGGVRFACAVACYGAQNSRANRWIRAAQRIRRAIPSGGTEHPEIVAAIRRRP